MITTLCLSIAGLALGNAYRLSIGQAVVATVRLMKTSAKRITFA